MIQLYLPGQPTPQDTQLAELEDAFARATIELCELQAQYGEALDCLGEALEWCKQAEMAGLRLPDNYDRWKKAWEIK